MSLNPCLVSKSIMWLFTVLCHYGRIFLIKVFLNSSMKSQKTKKRVVLSFFHKFYFISITKFCMGQVLAIWQRKDAIMDCFFVSRPNISIKLYLSYIAIFFIKTLFSEHLTRNSLFYVQFQVFFIILAPDFLVFEQK